MNGKKGKYCLKAYWRANIFAIILFILLSYSLVSSFYCAEMANFGREKAPEIGI
jgi:hypothetical protein